MTSLMLDRQLVKARGRPLALILLLVTGILIYAVPTFVTPPTNAAYITGIDSQILAVTLDNNVTVYRDPWGVPHIYAQSMSDAYLAAGYCMAEDRMFEMDLIRRYVSGRLSEIFGPSYLADDTASRTMGFYQIAQDTWDGVYAPDVVVSPEAKANLIQFAAGVNLFTSTWNETSFVDIPLEYKALLSNGVPYVLTLPSKPQNQWTPVQSLAVAGFMGWLLSDSSEQEIIRGGFAANVDPLYAMAGLPDMSDFLMPSGISTHQYTWNFPPTNITIDPLEGGGGGGGNYEVYDALKRLSSLSEQLGSNNWIISDGNTTTGNAMLANDPHLPLMVGGIVWECHIVTPTVNVAGVMVPGGPVIFSGHNDYFAFGVTNFMADILDLYYYVFDDPVNPTAYWYEPLSTWLPVTTQTEYITVVGTPVPVTINYTMHGPLINTPAGKFAFKWGGKQFGYGEVTGFSKMNEATNRAEWKDACSDMCVILQNYVYADKDGNISWCPSGRIPIRDPNPVAIPGGMLPPTFGIAPSNGSAGQNEWMPGVYIPHSTSPVDFAWDPWPAPVSLPCIDDPAEGFIVTANNNPIDNNYWGFPWPVWIGPSYTYDAGYRAQRIEELITSLAPIDISEMQTIQTDVVSIPARNIVPILLAVMAGDTNVTIQNALAVLAGWNCSELRGLSAPLIWEAFLHEFTDNTFGDELWAAMGLYPFPNTIIPLWNMTQTWNTNPYAIALFDDQNTLSAGPFTPGFEFMPDIMNKSLHDALDWIAGELGPPADAAFSNWPYGALHRCQFGHPLGALLGYLNYPPNSPFGPGPVPMDGGSSTVLPGGHWHYHMPPSGPEYLLTGGGLDGTGSACYRGIYECKASWDTSLIVVPPGESANVTGGLLSPVFDAHYGDQFGLWLGNTYYWRPLLFAGVSGMGFPSTTLHPDVTPPVADIAGCPKTEERNTLVTFDGTGSYDNVGIVKWKWDFGDAYATPSNPNVVWNVSIATHTFVHPLPADGVYTVTLTVWDAEDLSDTATCEVNVYIAVGGEAEVIPPPPIVPLSLWIIVLALVIVASVAAVTALTLKKKKEH